MSNTDQYTVGWICALETEYVAARSFLDKKHGRPEMLSPNDNNHYTLGEIAGHYIVIAVLPDGEYGTSSAAGVARDMVHSFPNVRFGLMVGIGGGAPTTQDVRLGDVVVSSSRSGHGGLLQYDLGKQVQDQAFHQTGFLNQPPPILRTAVSGLQAQYEEEGHQLKESIKSVLEGNKRLKRKYDQPPAESDRLYNSQFTHILDSQSTCAELCDDSELIFRPERTEDEDNPAIHYGLIASGNRVIKDAIFRDKVSTEKGVLCFEMEAAGLANHFPCLVIRGICDYADSHKCEEWQGYAAMAAAAYAKDLLHQIVPQRVDSERKAREVLDGIQNQLEDVSRNVHDLRSITRESAKDINAITEDYMLKELPVAAGAEFGNYMDQHEEGCLPGTRKKLLLDIEKWAALPEGKCIFWLNGSAGTGKSTISRTVAKTFQQRGLLGASFFFKRGEGDRGTAARFFPTITKQLLTKIPKMKHIIMHILKEDLSISAKPLKVQFDKLVLQPLLGLEESNFPTQTLVVAVDALDECESDDDIRVILHLIPQLKQIRSVHLRIFVTSRPELAIRLGFQEEVGDDHQDFILHQVPNHIIKEDISLFLEHRLGRIRKKRYLPPGWPGGTNTQMLITMSVPLFIFAATICRILLDYQWDPDDSLAEILIHHTDISQLNGTYLPVLDRLLVARDGSKKVQLIEEYQTVLGTIILLESPLSLNALATLLGVQKHFLHIRLNSLHSILDVPHNETTPIRLFHISLRDFLLNANTRERTPLWIDQKEINQKLTSRCLDIMQQKLKKNICNLQSYGVERTTINSQCMSDHLPPELQYSCRYWVHHLAGSRYPRSQIDVIAAFLDVHLLHWVEVMSILGIISEVLGNIRKLQSVTQDKKNSEVSKFLHDAERFVLKNSQIADIAPLQIYASGLLFAPARSIVRRKFGKDFPGWADGYPRVEETWSPELQTLEGHSKSVLSIAFSPDGQDLASASNDTTIKVWDSATGHLKHTLDGHSSSVLAVAFSPDGKRLVSTSDGTIKIWDSATGYLKQSFKCYPGPVQSVSFSPDSQRLASTSYDRTIKIWDSITGNLQQTISAHYDLVESVSFSPNGQQLASASDDRTIKIWDSATGNLQQTLNGHLNWVWSATFSLDGQRLASASSDRTIKIWDPVTGHLEQSLEGHSGPVWSVAFSPDGQLLASTSYDGTIKIWYPNTGVLKQTLKGHSNSVVSITFRPDGQQLASASHDRTIKIWDPNTDDMKYTHEGHSGPVRLFAFSPDGQRLASVSNDTTIKIWDPDTGGLKYTIHTERVATNIRFSTNSPHLITNVGNFNIAQFYEISFLSSQETSPEISIIQAGQWVTIRGMKELWLPQEYRPRRSAIKNGAVALGFRSGRVSVIKFCV